jgi:hypothetical protein
MLNPWFWLEPFFDTPKASMAEAEASKQKHAEAMLNPVPSMTPEQEAIFRDKQLWQLLDKWRIDNVLTLEVADIELDDLFERLRDYIKSLQKEEERRKEEAERAARTAYKI